MTKAGARVKEYLWHLKKTPNPNHSHPGARQYRKHKNKNLKAVNEKITQLKG